LLLLAVTVSLPWHGLQTHHPLLGAFDDRLAVVEITAFQTAPFEDALAESETIDVRRHYYKLPVKQLAVGPSDADNPSADLYPHTVAYPRESIAAAHQKSQTLIVFYHGENNKANATNTISSSFPTVVPLC
jgi:hypothetical protein